MIKKIGVFGGALTAVALLAAASPAGASLAGPSGTVQPSPATASQPRPAGAGQGSSGSTSQGGSGNTSQGGSGTTGQGSSGNSSQVSPASASQLTPASNAQPAPGPSGSATQYTAGAPGYGATDSSGFAAATATTTLTRDVGVFSSGYQPFVTLETSDGTDSPEVELIPTTNSSAPSDSWAPNGDIGNTGPSSFFWVQPTAYPAHSACAGNTDPRGCFWAGETVTLSVYYNTGTHIAYMTVIDPNNGDEYSADYDYTRTPVTVAAPAALPTAHVGDVWLAAYDNQPFTAPKRAEALNSFTSVTLTDTSGRTRALGEWTHYQRIMTSTGTQQGTTEITPGPLSWDGKSFGLTVK
jgi:hypothetical protein